MDARIGIEPEPKTVEQILTEYLEDAWAIETRIALTYIIIKKKIPKKVIWKMELEIANACFEYRHLK